MAQIYEKQIEKEKKITQSIMKTIAFIFKYEITKQRIFN